MKRAALAVAALAAYAAVLAVPPLGQTDHQSFSGGLTYVFKRPLP